MDDVRALPIAATSPVPEVIAWHAMKAADAMARLQTSPAGLTGAEAAARLQRHGPNTLPRRAPPGFGILFLRQFRSPLIYLLLAAAAVSLGLGKIVDAAFIGGVLLLNALIGALQERGAENSAEALQNLVRQRAQVRRDGVAVELDAAALVPGDIIEVTSGMRIAADARLIEAVRLSVNESLLTGESAAVGKRVFPPVPANAPLGDRTDLLHAGTTVEEGRGAAVVTATASETALGHIAGALARAAPTPPPLVLRMAKLSRVIAIGTIVAILPISIAQALGGTPLEQIFFLAVALAVSAIPEGLPVAVTVALSAATRRMAKRQVIVRQLPAVEGLGACTLIASDKTGTLTENRLSVEAVLLADGAALGRDKWRGANAVALGETAALCNEAALGGERPTGDTVDIALIGFAREAGLDPAALHTARPVLVAQPYEPARRYAATVTPGAHAGEATIHVKGAAETVLAMCDGVSAQARAAADALAADGYRVLALAARTVPGTQVLPDPCAPAKLTLLGFLGLEDPIRAEAPEAIRRCHAAGIGVRMVTGDHPATALAIARRLGLAAQADEVLTGAEMTALAADPKALAARIQAARVFARVEPVQKLMIVQALKAAGEIVAVTGDGANDAPALNAAHIGVAMGKSGTDVARGAADLIIADDNFASIVNGVEEGRITYANIRRIVMLLLATGLAEIILFMGALALGLPMPLTPVQLLWLNIATNGVQDVSLALGRGEGDELSRPPRPPRESLINAAALRLTIPAALWMSGATLALFAARLAAGDSVESARNMALFGMVLFENAFVFAMLSERRLTIFAPFRRNPWAVAGVLGALGLQLAAMCLPAAQAVLQTAPVPYAALLLPLLAAGGLLLMTDTGKLIAKRRRRETEAPAVL